MLTVSDIIEKAGGAKRIAEHLPVKKRSDGRAVDRSFSVYKWTQIGIPERHWPLLIELTGTTPAVLFDANRAVRQVAA